MKEWFHGKSIAVIGNAESLFSKKYGNLIDSHDIVCRINLGITVDSKETHGIKTDVFVFSRFSFVNNLGLFDHKNLKTDKFMHMSDRGRDVIRDSIFYYPLEMHSTLKEKLKLEKKEKPSTGIMILDYISQATPTNVSVFGFDWKETPTFYDKDRVDEPHIYGREKQYCFDFFINKLGYKYFK